MEHRSRFELLFPTWQAEVIAARPTMLEKVFSQLVVIKSRIVMSKNDLNMQRLHQSAVKGEILTAEEQKALQNWYEILDREEDAILNNSQKVQNVSELRKNLTQTTKQVAKISREIGSLLKQNEDLRKENQTLKKTLQSRLMDKVALALVLLSVKRFVKELIFCANIARFPKPTAAAN